MRISIKTVTVAFFLMTTALFSESGGQSEMNAQAQQMLESVDAGLNRVYKALLEERKSDTESVEKIRQSQREWHKGMEAEIGEAFPLKKGENPQELYGSSYPAEYCELRSQLILERIKELQKLGGRNAFDLDGFYKDHDSMRTEPSVDPSELPTTEESEPVENFDFDVEEQEVLKAYNELLRQLTPEQGVALKSSQQAWVVYRQAQFSLIDSLFQSGAINKDSVIAAKGVLMLDRRREMAWLAPSSKPVVPNAVREPVVASAASAKPDSRVDAFVSTNPIVFDGMWFIKNTNAKQIVEKYKNVGKKPIKAFKATIFMIDDFDEVKSQFETVYDSNSMFLSDGNRAGNHIIQPGDSIYIQSVSIEYDGTYVTVFDFNPFLETFKVRSENDLPPGCVADREKLRFRLDKVTYAD